MIPVVWSPYPARPGLLPLDGGAPKIVWHTTEGSLVEECAARDMTAFRKLLDGTLNYYNTSGYVVHYTVCAQLREVHQHLPLNVGGYALEDQAGGIRPNRAGSPIIQFEQVGHAVQLDAEMSDDDWRWMGQWLRQVCAETGVPFHFITPWLPYPQSYGAASGQRFTADQFVSFAGICGHEHVVENVHGDPGAIRLDLLTEVPLPPPVPPSTPPTPEDDMALYVTNAEQRHDFGRDFPPGGIIYAIDGAGKLRNVKPAEWRAAKAKGAAAEPTPNDELDYQAA